MFHTRPKYCGLRPRYIPYESMYSILSRFGLYNVVKGDSLIKIVKECSDSQPTKCKRIKNLAYLESVGMIGLQELLHLSPQQASFLFLNPTYIDSDRYVAPALRFCPICLSQGRHYTLFQYELIESCPVHGIGLISQCMHCSAIMSYELHAELFKQLYGCWHCGHKLGIERNSQSLRFISAPGMERLRSVHQMLATTKNKRISFDIVGPADLHCDNVLQLSQSAQQFAKVETALFHELQELACAPPSQSELLGFPTLRPSFTPLEQTEESLDILVNDLMSISKSIFRNFRKRYRIKFNLTQRLLGLLWRDIEGVLLPSTCYGVLAYLDWLCYWRNTKVPCELLSSARGSKRRITSWIAEKKEHKTFRQMTTPMAQRWLLQHILACEILTLLHQQIAAGMAVVTDCPSRKVVEVPYRRFFHPVCWAVIAVEQNTGAPILTFISAQSWKVGRGEGHTELPLTDGNSFHGQNLSKIFSSIMA